MPHLSIWARPPLTGPTIEQRSLIGLVARLGIFAREWVNSSLRRQYFAPADGSLVPANHIRCLLLQPRAPHAGRGRRCSCHPSKYAPFPAGILSCCTRATYLVP